MKSGGVEKILSKKAVEDGDGPTRVRKRGKAVRRRSQFLVSLSPSGAADKLATGLLAQIITAWHTELHTYGETFDIVLTGGTKRAVFILDF